MWEDPIVSEVRSIRENILAEFNYDIRAYAAHIMAIQEEKKRRGFRYGAPPGAGSRNHHPTGAVQVSPGSCGESHCS